MPVSCDAKVSSVKQSNHFLMIWQGIECNDRLLREAELAQKLSFFSYSAL